MSLSKKNRNFILSISIPLSIFLLAILNKILEYFFRSSVDYKYIYAYGSTFRFFFQLALLLIGLLRGIELLVNERSYLKKWEQILSALISLSPVIYVTLMILISMITDFYS